MGSSVKKRTSNTSSGTRSQAKLNLRVRKLRMKIARWERNQLDESKKAAGASRKGWNTVGLQSHLNKLEGLLKKR